MNKKKLYIWVSDYSPTTGEGKLGRLFIKSLNFENKYKLYFSRKNTSNYKYISSLNGIYFCWKHFLKDEKVCYLNYLPFWNFLVFLLLPPKTIIGPITGGANYSSYNKISYIVRRFFFPLFYKLSELCINLRKVKIFFSTDLLKKHLSKKTIKKFNFNFVLKQFCIKKKLKKKIDFLIYYRSHPNKNYKETINLIKRLILLNYKIYIVGDKLKIKYVKNYGRVSNSKMSKLQSIAKYTICSSENIYTIFILECLSNNVKIIFNKKWNQRIHFKKKSFIKLNFENLDKIKKINF